ncbi:hypothetical protein [Bacillus suaedae]|uniref:Uncharacterized protein n=1 Tax=Halalkalibacter suaedae TaxID=2822140 RepID=A0A940WU43_9BACI|nr:hypothetical protein [Bacillus suaedae]MBP3951788.1 hypothetical protein [Bacillus suaedae]
MTLESLEKSDLSSVVFIRDYIQFVFEGEKENVILSAFTQPSTIVSNQIYEFQSAGWRDALCTLINKIVRTAIAEEGIAIKITFEDGDVLEISLRKEDYEGPEAAMLCIKNGEIRFGN